MRMFNHKKSGNKEAMYILLRIIMDSLTIMEGLYFPSECVGDTDDKRF